MTTLDDAIAILGPPLKIDGRGWATWWCPFHDDLARRGSHGNPNFGVNLEQGFWKCLRCGQTGGSMASLRRKLGEWRAPVANGAMPKPSRPQVAQLDEALTEARSALTQSPAWEYLARRGVSPRTALQYGLGYGVPNPSVHLDTVQAARSSHLVAYDGLWLWAGGVVYAEPPINPTTIQVRHLRQGADKKYQTWGRLLQPLGSWRLAFTTRTLVVVEGMMDMLVTSQYIQEQKAQDTVVVYTGGSSVSRAMLEWFASSPYNYVLIPDPDEAGVDWVDALVPAIQHSGGKFIVSETPEGLDPDEAILKGWQPKIFQ